MGLERLGEFDMSILGFGKAALRRFGKFCRANNLDPPRLVIPLAELRAELANNYRILMVLREDTGLLERHRWGYAEVIGIFNKEIIRFLEDVLEVSNCAEEAIQRATKLGLKVEPVGAGEVRQ